MTLRGSSENGETAGTVQGVVPASAARPAMRAMDAGESVRGGAI
jgi:hypothetical protein